LCGSADEELQLNSLQARFCPDAPVLAGRLNLRALTVFLKYCNLVFASDSGPRHLANAAGIPVVFLRNLNARRAEAGPYLDTETDLAPSLECLRLKPAEMAHLPPSAEDIARHLACRLR
ncbi:MAG: hypothetical protein N2255_04395, partial [Kiritimatiellae bacterium]|nr:hypothetical protein [Kiritimatiellia bacterium]